MELSLMMLGTGSAFAKKYYNTSALIACGDYNLMLDCGHTVPRSLYDMNISLGAINGIFISHLHEDHIGGLEEVAFRMMYEFRRKMPLFVPEALMPILWENSLRGNLENTADGIHSLDDYFDVVVLQDGMRTPIIPGLTIETLHTIHVKGKPSYGAIINDFLYFSADSVFDRKRIEAVLDRGCTVILHDCQLNGPGIIHATLSELLTLPDDIQRNIRLMHYGDAMEDYIGKSGHMEFLQQHHSYQFRP
ncbi:MBL fold metallo-hydrolase [Paenibacillus cymbidii]|uniref:MBL fold metallo-hydrolase n=1 Tax=Paenibacillus cymbidii TaxID=1639034 RepID=UPI00108226AF|nr:MBL fold metallo-hydrolase [Paenibacillus cymbidii]